MDVDNSRDLVAEFRELLRNWQEAPEETTDSGGPVLIDGPLAAPGK
jgi:hypothetical protein